jgi:type III secretion system YscQ/HrcQ family protein
VNLMPAAPAAVKSPPWTAAEAQATGALAALAGVRLFDGPSCRGRLTFRPFDSEPGPRPAVVVGLTCGARAAALGLDGWSLAAFHPAARGLDPERLAPDLRLALIDLLLQPLVDDLSAFLGEEVFFQKTFAGGWPETGRVARFGLELRSADGSADASGPDGPAAPGSEAEGRLSAALAVALTADDWRWLAAKLAAAPRPRAADLRFLSLPLQIVLGGLTLPLADVRALAPGDLLVPDEPPIRPGLAWLACPGLLDVALAVEDGRGEVLQCPQTKETPVDDDQATTPQETADGGAPGPRRLERLEDLELPLLFEIGRQSLTLRDLEALVPGAVLPITADLQGPVTVTCRGQRLGKGLLVDLGGGVLGVQLTEVVGALGVQLTDVVEAQAAERLETDERSDFA